MIKFWSLLKKVPERILPVLIFHHAVVKREITKKYGSKKHILLDLLCVCGALLFLCLTISILITFAFYKYLVYVYLYVKHGRRLQGMITGSDLLSILAPGCDGRVHGLVQCATDKKFNGEELYTLVKQRIYEKYYLTDDVDQKFFSIRAYTRFGYHYFKQVDGVKVDQIVKCIKVPNKDIKEPATDAELMSLGDSFYNSDLPENDKFNWDICICLHPIINTDNNKTRFVIFTRMHHAIGDGLVIYNVLINSLFKMGSELESYTRNLVAKTKIDKRKNYTHVHTFGRQNFIDKPCILRDGKPHVRSSFSARCEPPSDFSYLDKIKEIRKKFPGVGTFNVLMTAYSASLADYYLKYSGSAHEIPEYIYTTHPIQLNIRRYLEMYTASKKIPLGNEVASFGITVPIIPKSKRGIPIKDFLVERLLEMRDSFTATLQSFDIQANFIFGNMYFNVLPYFIINKGMKGIYFQTLTTSLPGGPSLELFTGDSVENVYYFLPRQYYSTLLISINTYGNRLQIGLTGDKEKIDSLDKLNELSDGIFKYIDLLHEECMKYTML